jgi:hypothetical protein
MKGLAMRSPRRWRWAIGCAVGLLALTGLLFTMRDALPERFDPWAPLEIAAPPNLLTGLKLRRAQADAALCMTALADSGLRYEPVGDRVLAAGCELRSAVRLRRGHSVALGTPVLLSCRSALAFAMWERHALQAAAADELGSPIVAVAHLGGYTCRDLNRGEGAPPSGRRSTHATADALDVTGFTTGAGRHISVRGDWSVDDASQEGADASSFLRRVHEEACRYYDGVLGPDFNAVHADHFHLEAGGGRFCQ